MANKKESEIKAEPLPVDLSPTIPVHNGEFTIHSNGEEPIRKSSSNSGKINNQVNTQPSIHEIGEIKSSTTNVHYNKGKEMIDKIEKNPLRRSLIKQCENQVNQRNLTEIDLKFSTNSVDKNCMCRIF